MVLIWCTRIWILVTVVRPTGVFILPDWIISRHWSLLVMYVKCIWILTKTISVYAKIYWMQVSMPSCRLNCSQDSSWWQAYVWIMPLISIKVISANWCMMNWDCVQTMDSLLSRFSLVSRLLGTLMTSTRIFFVLAGESLHLISTTMPWLIIWYLMVRKWCRLISRIRKKNRI